MTMLIAYDASGGVVAILDEVVALNASGDVVGLIDFAAHEAANGENTDIWVQSNATGSKTWPEHLGAGALDFRVELAGKAGHKRIAALVRQPTPAGARDMLGRFRPVTAGGHRRERTAIEAAIEAAEPDETGARYIRHLVGGPHRPIALDKDGRTAERPLMGTPAHLPLVGD